MESSMRVKHRHWNRLIIGLLLVAFSMRLIPADAAEFKHAPIRPRVEEWTRVVIHCEDGPVEAKSMSATIKYTDPREPLSVSWKVFVLTLTNTNTVALTVLKNSFDVPLLLRMEGGIFAAEADSRGSMCISRLKWTTIAMQSDVEKVAAEITDYAKVNGLAQLMPPPLPLLQMIPLEKYDQPLKSGGFPFNPVRFTVVTWEPENLVFYGGIYSGKIIRSVHKKNFELQELSLGEYLPKEARMEYERIPFDAVGWREHHLRWQRQVMPISDPIKKK